MRPRSSERAGYRRAALWIGNNDVDEAMRHWQRVRELLASAQDANADELRLTALGAAHEQFEVPMWCHAHAAELAWIRGDAAAAESAARRANEYAERAGGAAQLRAYATRAVVQSRLLAGALDDAEEAARGWLTLYERERVELIEKPAALAWLAETQRRRGSFGPALETAEQGLVLAQRMPRRVIEVILRLTHAVGLAHASKNEDAMRSLARACELVEATGAATWQPFIHEARADVATVCGDEELRTRELREARRLFTALGCPGRVEQIDRKLATP